jgi:hypothetical protein
MKRDVLIFDVVFSSSGLLNRAPERVRASMDHFQCTEGVSEKIVRLKPTPFGDDVL